MNKQFSVYNLCTTSSGSSLLYLRSNKKGVVTVAEEYECEFD